MLFRILLLTASVLISGTGTAQQKQLPLIELSAGMHRIEAELAANSGSRQIGLMQRTAMAPQRGMLFVFPEVGSQCMWMRNTLIPLSVAFLDDRGRIINIEDMKPKSENTHCATKPARYALEMNIGWFRSRGLGAGSLILGIDKAPPGN
ncbi:MAG: DUF192 domain-containing protein [Sulfuritalea sp.]|nr:DUF192 domain-containing protein [Sulfuritalea sp.]